MFEFLWKFLSNYVIISIKGFSFEKTINLALNHNIYIWDISEQKSNCQAKVYYKDLKKIQNISENLNNKIEIIKICGIINLLRKFKLHKLFVIGIFIYVFILYALTSFIWNIEVEGNESITTSAIIEFCKAKGYKVGTFIYTYDTKELEQQIIDNFNTISWVSIKTEGTLSTISLKETIKENVLNQETKPCDIISNKDGIITDISVKTGLAKVKTYDVVKKGDLLVSGVLTYKENDQDIIYGYTNSNAKIRCKYIDNFNIVQKYCYNIKTYTNNIDKHKIYTIFNKNITFDFFKNKFKNYDVVNDTNQIILFNSLPLPIFVNTTYYKEYKNEERLYNYDEAKTMLEANIIKEIIKRTSVKAEIIDKKVNYKKDKKQIIAEVQLIVIDDIGEIKYFNPNERSYLVDKAN